MSNQKATANIQRAAYLVSSMKTDRFGIAIVFVFAVIFAAIAFFCFRNIERIEIRFGVSVVLFGVYCMVVAIYSTGKKREISLFWQTVFGAITALCIAAIFRSPPEDYILTIPIGVVLGVTAHKWVIHLSKFS